MVPGVFSMDARNDNGGNVSRHVGSDVTESREDEFELPVAAWSAWAPGLDSTLAWGQWAAGKSEMLSDGTPELAFVAPMMRRRLGRTARMMLWVAQQCAGDREGLRTVFASRHGELNRTVPMLRELARNNELSPTDFSLSVHNAAAGVCSIVRRDRSASVSVAAGEESLGYGLLEAALQWRLKAQTPVLVVFANDTVPPEYSAFVSNQAPHALALLLSAEAKTLVRLRRSPSPPGALPSAEPQSLTFLRAWITQQPRASWTGARDVWEWDVARHAA